MTTQTFEASVNDATSTATIMAVGGAGAAFHVFRPKAVATKAETKPTTVLPKSVQAVMDAADALVAGYTKLKVEVLDRSDRALWEMLEKAYAFAAQIDGNALTKREARTELIKKIQQRDKQTMASNSSTEAVVVRYVFADQSRQSRNNYTIAMEKARALNIPVDGFADFLTENGGVGKVVEKIFGYEDEDAATAKELTDALKAEKTNRTQLVGRLYSLMAHSAETQISYSGLVSNWVPKSSKSTPVSKGNGVEKTDPKFEQGNFVFFVTVKNPETGKYRVVQGNIFDKAYEQQLLAAIAERMDVPTEELSTAVQGLEKSIGFGDLAHKEQEFATA
jgi:hypothetical protein